MMEAEVRCSLAARAPFARSGGAGLESCSDEHIDSEAYVTWVEGKEYERLRKDEKGAIFGRLSSGCRVCKRETDFDLHRY